MLMIQFLVRITICPCMHVSGQFLPSVVGHYPHESCQILGRDERSKCRTGEIFLLLPQWNRILSLPFYYILLLLLSGLSVGQCIAVVYPGIYVGGCLTVCMQSACENFAAMPILSPIFKPSRPF